MAQYPYFISLPHAKIRTIRSGQVSDIKCFGMSAEREYVLLKAFTSKETGVLDAWALNASAPKLGVVKEL